MKLFMGIDKQRGMATLWALVALGIVFALTQQFQSRLRSRNQDASKSAQRIKMSMVADYFVTQMRQPRAAFNTRKANPAFDLKASQMPDSSNSDLVRRPLEARDSSNRVLIPTDGVYMNRTMDIVPAGSRDRIYQIKAYWQAVEVKDPDIENQNGSKPLDMLDGLRRVQKIVVVNMLTINQGEVVPKIEKRMGADKCLVVRSRMFSGTEPIIGSVGQTYRVEKGLARCPRGYQVLSGYMTDHHRYHGSSRFVWTGYSSSEDAVCYTQTDWILSVAPPERWVLGSSIVMGTENGGVDKNRSVLPQDWQGKAPYPNEPENSCYALCCETGID